MPADAADWKAALRQRGISAREVLSRHRWAIGALILDGLDRARAG